MGRGYTGICRGPEGNIVPLESLQVNSFTGENLHVTQFSLTLAGTEDGAKGRGTGRGTDGRTDRQTDGEQN